jgi:hypothetical protein
MKESNMSIAIVRKERFDCLSRKTITDSTLIATYDSDGEFHLVKNRVDGVLGYVPRKVLEGYISEALSWIEGELR